MPQPADPLVRAKAQQFAQTERVRRLHAALLLTEVEKQREAQIELKQRLLRRKKLEDTKVQEEIERLWEHHLWEQAMKEQAKQKSRQNLKMPPELLASKRETLARAARYATERLERDDQKRDALMRKRAQEKEEQRKQHPTSQEIEKLWKQLEEQNAREAQRIQQGVFEKLFAAQREKERARRQRTDDLFEKPDGPELTERVVYHRKPGGGEVPMVKKKFGPMEIVRQERIQKQRNLAEKLCYEPKRGSYGGQDAAFDLYATSELESQEYGLLQGLSHNLIDPNDPRLTYARQYSDITKDTSTAIFEDWKNNLRKYNILKRAKRVLKS